MSFDTGLSGLNAAMRSLDAAAFQMARSASQRGGAPAPTTDDAAAAPAPDGTPATAPGIAPAAGAAPAATAPAADVDLPREMIAMISASHAFLANLQTIKRTDEALQSLLDLRK